MRQYWIPAAKSSELTAGGPPLRLALLGEKLIAFRSKSNEVGVLDHRCPHRGASLFFGRNEDDGVRCVYHGWKFGPGGDCLDMPNLLPEQSFAHKVRATAHRAVDRYGLLWVYMGARAEPPPLPDFGPLCKPEDETDIFLALRECNWLQGMEGDIDISHFAFLHLGGVAPADLPEDNVWRLTLAKPASYEVLDTRWGTMYGAKWASADKCRTQTYWKVSHFGFPFWTIPPDGTMGEILVAHATVPMDDTHTMRVNLTWPGRKLHKLADGKPIPGLRPTDGYLPNTTDWFGRWRLARNASNDYNIDRDMQQSTTFTGINGIYHQDQAITESIGPVSEHSREHLGPSDRMIIQTRKRLVNAIEAFVTDGVIPSVVDDPAMFHSALGGGFYSSSSQDFVTAYLDQLESPVASTSITIGG